MLAYWAPSHLINCTRWFTSKSRSVSVFTIFLIFTCWLFFVGFFFTFYFQSKTGFEARTSCFQQAHPTVASSMPTTRLTMLNQTIEFKSSIARTLGRMKSQCPKLERSASLHQSSEQCWLSSPSFCFHANQTALQARVLWRLGIGWRTTIRWSSKAILTQFCNPRRTHGVSSSCTVPTKSFPI